MAVLTIGVKVLEGRQNLTTCTSAFIGEYFRREVRLRSRISFLQPERTCCQLFQSSLLQNCAVNFVARCTVSARLIFRRGYRPHRLRTKSFQDAAGSESDLRTRRIKDVVAIVIFHKFNQNRGAEIAFGLCVRRASLKRKHRRWSFDYCFHQFVIHFVP